MIVEETIQIKTAGNRHGVLASAVIQGRVTELLDIEGVIRSAAPAFYDRAEGAEARA